MIHKIIGVRYFSASGMIFPKIYPVPSIPHVQTKPPTRLYLIKVLYSIPATPATIGTNVLTTGINLAKNIVFFPYFS